MKQAFWLWIVAALVSPSAWAQAPATQPAAAAATPQDDGPRAVVTGRVTLAAGRDIVAPRDGRSTSDPAQPAAGGDGNTTPGQAPGPGGAKYILSLALDVAWSGDVKCLVPPASWTVERFELDPPVTVDPKVSSTFEVPVREFLWQRYAALHRRMMLFTTTDPVCDPADQAGAAVSVLGLTQRPRTIQALTLQGEGWFARPADPREVTLGDGATDHRINDDWTVAMTVDHGGSDGPVLPIEVERTALREAGPFPPPDALNDMPVGVSLLNAAGEVVRQVPLGWVSPESEGYDPGHERYFVSIPWSEALTETVERVQVWFVPSVDRREVRVGLESVEVP